MATKPPTRCYNYWVLTYYNYCCRSLPSGDIRGRSSISCTQKKNELNRASAPIRGSTVRIFVKNSVHLLAEEMLNQNQRWWA